MLVLLGSFLHPPLTFVQPLASSIDVCLRFSVVVLGNSKSKNLDKL